MASAYLERLDFPIIILKLLQQSFLLELFVCLFQLVLLVLPWV